MKGPRKSADAARSQAKAPAAAGTFGLPLAEEGGVLLPEVIEPGAPVVPDAVADVESRLPEILEAAPEAGSTAPTAVPPGYALVPVGADSDALMAADPLTAYLSRLRGIEPLAAEEQQRLAERYHTSQDAEAARLLILSNVRLVVKIAREYRRRREGLMELIQEGNVGLTYAIQRYDPYRGVKFSSYAQYWIRAMILNYLMNAVQTVKIGSTRAGRKLFFNLKRERDQLVRENNAQPTTRLLADRLGVDESEVVDVLRVIDSPPLSFEAPAPGHEKGTLGAVLADGAASPEDEAVQNDLRERFSRALADFGATLTDERERLIWSQRVLSATPKSLQELGDEFDVSRERIRQLEAGLKKRVKAYLTERFGSDEIHLAVGD